MRGPGPKGGRKGGKENHGREASSSRSSASGSASDLVCIEDEHGSHTQTCARLWHIHKYVDVCIQRKGGLNVDFSVYACVRAIEYLYMYCVAKRFRTFTPAQIQPN